MVWGERKLAKKTDLTHIYWLSLIQVTSRKLINIPILWRGGGGLYQLHILLSKLARTIDLLKQVSSFKTILWGSST